MTQRFKFAEPRNSGVVEIDPKSGNIYTSVTGAEVDYRMLADGETVELTISNQDFGAEDVAELINLLECIHDRLKKVS